MALSSFTLVCGSTGIGMGHDSHDGEVYSAVPGILKWKGGILKGGSLGPSDISSSCNCNSMVVILINL